MTAINDFFLHNWQANATLETSYLTDVVQSFDALTEERRALLDRPRRVLTLQWTAVKQDEMNRLLMELMRGGMQQLLVPFAMDQSVTTGTSSGTTIACPTTQRHFAVGAQVLIFSFGPDRRPANPQTFLIDGLASGAITTHTAISGSYAAGALVFPLMLAELILQGDVSLLTDQKGDLSLSFYEVAKSAIASSALVSSPGPFATQTSAANSAASSTTPVLDVSPDFGATVKVAVGRAGTKYALGRDTAVDVQGTRPLLEHAFQLSLFKRSDSWGFLEFFDSRKGRLLPFWLVNPATLYTPVATASGYVDVAVSGSLQNAQDFLEYVAVVMNDGTIYVRKVTSVALVSGNWRISASLPSLTLSDVKRVTSAHFVRFSNDALKLDYLSDGVALAQVATVEILAETVTDADPTTIPACGSSGDSCIGPWSVCMVGYLMDPGSIAGDCPRCLIGLGHMTFNIGLHDSCTQNMTCSMAYGYWDGATFHIGSGGCAGINETFPVELADTHGEYVLVYSGGSGAGYHVYANMTRSTAGPPTPCAFVGATVHDDRVAYGAPCVTDVPVQSGWF